MEESLGTILTLVRVDTISRVLHRKVSNGKVKWVLLQTKDAFIAWYRAAAN